MTEQGLGLITGALFGVLLQKGRVLRFEKQIGAMRLQDMTILKFMLSAIIVGMAGLYLLSDAGVISLKHKPMNLGAVAIGGVLFGAGWAVMGYCPGTSIGALGEGRWHAAWAVLGMLLGAALYAELYPAFKATVLTWKDWGAVSLEQALGVPHWLLIPALSAVYLGLFVLFERKRL
jgi:uncharacterized membrane protein YedE/YeeE